MRLGALGAAGFSLARALELLDLVPLAGRSRSTSVILVWLDGGLSHIDTFDAKPGAPEEIRGDWKSVATPIPGVRFGEGMERLAAAMPRCALIRSLHSEAGEHEIARHMMLTGYPQTPALEYPCYGAVAADRLGEDAKGAAVPPYLAIGPMNRQLGAGFLPPDRNPFEVEGNPATPEFVVRDVTCPAGLTPDRVARRRLLMEELDDFRRRFEAEASVRARSKAIERAYALVSSKDAREAFALDREPQSTRDRYGMHPLGQRCLMARRLVEAGARFVTVIDPGWDHHSGIFEQLKLHRIPKLDQAIPALLDDLAERGRLADTLVVVIGDFGRTPKLNPMGGRDHWPRANVALLAGAGVKGGTVVGATDERAESVVERPVSIADFAATLYTLVGIDPKGELHTADGRPVRLVDGGEPVAECLA
ncbi:MAG TPA: DUF1501 domain-containing protein [Planctomycetota bacterium]|nr:DUF1501 domain-containing protein [Planctomycetota bacterium]